MSNNGDRDGDDVQMSEELYDAAEDSAGGDTDSTDAEDAKIREECEQELDPDLVKFSDLLVKRFENKLVRNNKQILTLCTQANKKSSAALKISKANEAEIAVVKQTAETALAATIDQGKQLKDLQAQFRSVQTGSLQGMTQAPGLKFTKLSAAERIQKLQARYDQLVRESANTSTFRLGKKKGEPDGTMAQAKQVFEAFFPDVEYVIAQPQNAKFFHIRILNPAEAVRLQALSKTSWVELNAVGWWLGPDRPEDMQKLEARARAFLAFVKGGKDGRPDRKKEYGYIQVENGMLSKGGKELLPLLFIPGQSGGKWPELGALLLRHIESLGDDLLGVYDDNSSNFYAEWLEKAGFGAFASDMREISATTVNRG